MRPRLSQRAVAVKGNLPSSLRPGVRQAGHVEEREGQSGGEHWEYLFNLLLVQLMRSFVYSLYFLPVPGAFFSVKIPTVFLLSFPRCGSWHWIITDVFILFITSKLYRHSFPSPTPQTTTHGFEK